MRAQSIISLGLLVVLVAGCSLGPQETISLPRSAYLELSWTFAQFESLVEANEAQLAKAPAGADDITVDLMLPEPFVPFGRAELDSMRAIAIPGDHVRQFEDFPEGEGTICYLCLVRDGKVIKVFKKRPWEHRTRA